MPLPLSAGDWIRMKRLVGGNRYQAEKDKDITNVALPADSVRPFPLTRDVGSSKTRREASKWTDYVASLGQDYTLKSEGTNSILNTITLKQFCSCKTNIGWKQNKFVGCSLCTPAQHLRMT
jgi:hypothetical protein